MCVCVCTGGGGGTPLHEVGGSPWKLLDTKFMSLCRATSHQPGQFEGGLLTWSLIQLMLSLWEKEPHCRTMN